jgi:hypothetical protein
MENPKSEPSADSKSGLIIDPKTAGSKPVEPKSKGFSFVKGGTSTQKNDELWETRYREAEVRRNVADAERKIGRVPIEKGGARLFTSQMTGHPEVPKAYVLLDYFSRSGERTGLQVLADVIVGIDASLPTELTMVIVCPRCVQGAKHQQDCQLQIRQSNKSFELVTGKGNPTFEFEGKIYKSAGVIKYCEKFRCPDCDWTARIENSQVRCD